MKSNMIIPTLPTEPGCYFFKNNKDIILYIGKAKDLKKRVSSYFTKKNHDPKTQILISLINKIDFIVTKTEYEALILENNLIKKHTPKYNIDLKDSKRYAYIELTNEAFPKIQIARKKINNSKYFGPFTSAETRDYILEILKRNFKIRTCKKFPKKPCLRYHIDLCDAPCINNISAQEYNNKIRIVESILKGNTKNIKKILKKQMKNNSKNLNYENALTNRNQINAIDYLKEKQNMERKRYHNEDVINYIIKDNIVYLLVFNIYKGTLDNKQEFTFDYNEDFFEEFILQYYSKQNIPKEIILPHDISESLNIFLNKKKKKKVEITIPKIGEKKLLLDLVKKNIEIIFFSHFDKLIELKNQLNLEEIPTIIECFDVSHLTGTSTVGSMVQFKNAIPNYENYRRFKIKTVDKIDDYASLAEIVRRRYYKIKIQNLRPPNLIIIDGGKGQLNISLKELKKLGFNTPIISIAKEFEEIYIPSSKEPLRLKKSNQALQLIQQIRDEAHRFAIKYNRLLRKKELLK